MELTFLQHIRCPSRIEGSRRCLSDLRVDETASEPGFFTTDGGDPDLREGVLRCDACGAGYPVICGVPILAAPVAPIVRTNYYFFLGFAREMEMPLGALRGFLHRLVDDPDPSADDAKANPPPPQPYTRAWSIRIAKFLSSYQISHHLGLERVPGLSDGQRRLAEEMRRQGEPHDVLLGMIDELAGPATGATARTGLSLDIGCSVGGLTARMAERFDAALGVDISFESLVYARAMLKARPRSMCEVTVFTEGDNRISCPAEARDGSRCEFVLAEGDALPFADGTFQAAASCNLVDVMNHPRRLLEEKRRVLDADGSMLMSTPFLFSSAGVSGFLGPEGKLPAETLEETLQDLGFEVCGRREDVPWVLYHYRRRIDYYLTLCLAARRPAGERRDRGGPSMEE